MYLWQLGVVVCALVSIREVALHCACTWMADRTVLTCNQPARSTQPPILWGR